MDIQPNLLVGLTFVGREDELTELSERLQDPACRLITLIGPGGIGKTRLAQQAAALHKDAFLQGVVVVPLASLFSADYLFPALAEALHFSFYAREDLPGQLLNYLREKQLLLILDGFEQVIASAAWIGELLRAAPGVKTLVTSREQLGLREEQVITLQGMRLPTSQDAADFDDSPAVRLFLNNARLLNPFYEIAPADRPHVLRICQMVGGLPLAIQMAAAWTRAITSEQIAREIERDMDFLRAPFRSAPERHQSLKVIFEYSWRMLPHAERVVCRQLSVFCDAFTLDAAQQVAGASAEQLVMFARKSFLQSEPAGTYRMHATLRQYAAARLAQDADEERQTRQRHAAYFGNFLQSRQLHLESGRQSQALREIAEVLDDVRAAWQFIVREGDFESLQRAASSLYLFLSIRACSREGLDAFGKAIAMCEASPNCSCDVLACLKNYQAVFAIELNEYSIAEKLLQQSLSGDAIAENQAFAHQLSARLAILLDDHAEAIQHGRNSLEICDRIQDRRGQAKALDTLGAISWTLGDSASAEQYFQQALALFRQLDVQQGIAGALDHLGVVARDRGDYASARSYFEESRTIFRELDARINMAYVANHLGGIVAMMGDPSEAEPYFQECISIGREIGEQRVVAYTLTDWGGLLGASPEHHARAQALLAEAFTAFERLSELFGLVMVRLSQAMTELTVNDLPAAWPYYQDGLRIALKTQNPRLINDALSGFVGFFEKKQDYAAAASLLSFLLSSAVQRPGELTANDQALMERFQAQLSEEQFAAAIDRGRRQTLETYTSQLLEAE